MDLLYDILNLPMTPLVQIEVAGIGYKVSIKRPGKGFAKAWDTSLEQALEKALEEYAKEFSIPPRLQAKLTKS